MRRSARRRLRERIGPWPRRVASLVWELPQNVLGAVNAALVVVSRRSRAVRFERERVMVELLPGKGAAVSLGLFVFWTPHDNPWVPVGRENRAHEYGHSIQSRWLGPLYLPLVGAPSSLRASYAVVHKLATGHRWAHYYDGWPERSADRLGGVDVTLRPPP